MHTESSVVYLSVPVYSTFLKCRFNAAEVPQSLCPGHIEYSGIEYYDFIPFALSFLSFPLASRLIPPLTLSHIVYHIFPMLT